MTLFVLLIFAGFCPIAAAAELDPFPDVTFKVFSDFISNNFSSKISLATVSYCVIYLDQ